jgi:hypothetical protein
MKRANFCSSFTTTSKFVRGEQTIGLGREKCFWLWLYDNISMLDNAFNSWDLI